MLGVIVAVVIVIAGGIWGIKAWNTHQQNNARASLAAGYATQPLTSPFMLESRTWQASSGTWQYDYTASLGPPAAITAAKTQLGRGAYQVVEGQPDAIGTASATLYRDLITEDVALKIIIGPVNEAAPGSTASTPVKVTVSPLTGG